MDVKSLSKSKRAHSQHHSKKHHPNQKPKAPAGSIGAASPNKLPGKQIKGKSPQFQSPSALSSNWDRYEEDDYDLGLDDPSQSSSSQPSDVIVRKSKGADYSYLISEAKSHSVSFPSFDDVFSDFNQGVGTLVSVRGHTISSRNRDDNFLVEDQATSNLEASFLSLDLNSIAKQLAKLDLSQRLFIGEEDDFLLQELSTTTATALDQDIEIKITSSDTATTTTTTTATATHNRRSKSKNNVEDDPTIIGQTGQSTLAGPTTELNAHSIANPNKLSKFKAVAAEAELDMLLDSFNETNFLDPSGPASSTFQQEASFDQTVSTITKGRDLSKSALSSNLDSTIDDLLKETSGLIHTVNDCSAIKGPDLSELMVGPNPDHTIDDLLKETMSASLINKNDADVLANPSKSKLLDDFDSWLDTI